MSQFLKLFPKFGASCLISPQVWSQLFDFFLFPSFENATVKPELHIHDIGEDPQLNDLNAQLFNL